MEIYDKRGFIINLAIIATLVTAIYASQQPQAKEWGKKMYGQATGEGSYYATNVKTWFLNKTALPLDGGAEELKASISQEVTRQKNNAAQDLWENIKNYLAGKFNKTFGTEVK